LSGAAGNAASDSTTVTVKIYSGTGTGGTVVQTISVTRTGATWTTTAATLSDGTYTGQATQTDAVGNTGTSSANTFTVDTVTPSLTTLQMFDIDTDGKVDQVKATFDETLATYSAGNAPWALTNVPSTGSLNSVSVSGAVATLTITEGGGAADTGVGSFMIALAANANGIRDAAGNQVSFLAMAPADKAAPLLISATSGGGISNRMETSNTMDIVFTEPLAAASVPGTATVTEARSGGSTLTIPGIIQSASIANGYLNANGASGSATGTITLTNGGKTIHIVLGTVTNSGGGVATGSGGASLSPAGTITDVAGNAAVTGSSATCSPLF
jgi:hypothetical protein